MSLFRKFFDDKRYTVSILVAWMVTVCTIFYFLGAFHMSYMHMGPGKDTVFMGLRIDNWVKWSALATFSFMNTCINEFISNSLNPWFLNSLQDHKTRSIEYSHSTCLWIVQINCMYVHVMGVFSLFLFFSQVDFAIVRLLADWIVTGYSTVWFIQDKKYVRKTTLRESDTDASRRDELASLSSAYEIPEDPAGQCITQYPAIPFRCMDPRDEDSCSEGALDGASKGGFHCVS